MEKKINNYQISNERLYLRSHNINVCFRVIIDGTFNKSYIEESLKKLYIRHPLLKYSVDIDDENNAWLVQKNDLINIEYYNSNEIDWQRWYKKNQNVEFDFFHGALVKFCVIMGENTEIIVFGHHIIGDGMGYLILTKDFLLALDNRIEEIPQIPPFETKEKYFKKTVPLNIFEKIYARSFNKKWRKSQVKFLEKDYSVFFEQYKNKYIPNIFMNSIEGNDVKNIMEKSKASGLSVNELIVSAFSMAIMKFFNQNKIRLGVAASIRNELVSEPNNCMGNFVTGITLEANYNKLKDFISNAKKTAVALRNKLENIKKRHLVVHFLNEIDKDLIESIMFAVYGLFDNPVSKKLAKLIGVQTARKSLGISNLGRHDFNGYNNFKVNDIQFIGPSFPSHLLTLDVITINEKMNICLIFNESEIIIENIKKIYEKGIELLIHGKNAS